MEKNIGHENYSMFETENVFEQIFPEFFGIYIYFIFESYLWPMFENPLYYRRSFSPKTHIKIKKNRIKP